MADLELSGILHFHGTLTLQGSAGGKVKAGGVEVLVEQAGGIAPPYVFPPPPASPIDVAPDAVVVSSLNKTVRAAAKPIVTQGMAMQGSNPTWPGFVMRGASTVTVNQIPVNVLGEQATIFPSGGSAVFNESGQ